MILLGIDVGTTGCKAAVFAPDGTLLAPRCDVIEDGMAMYGMETFPTIAPLFSASPSREVMIETGLSTEHHAVPGRFVSFIFHMGGAAVNWYRDSLAAAEHLRAEGGGSQGVYQAAPVFSVPGNRARFQPPVRGLARAAARIP